MLAGALVVGGAAGIGGAAVYDTLRSDDAATQPAVASSSGVKVAADTKPVAGGAEGVAAKVLPSVVKVNVSGQGGTGSGSGVVLNDKGDILTNNHVVSVASRGGSVSVSFNDGSTAKASVVGTDPLTDMAVIHVDGAKGLTPITVGRSSALQVGQTVIAIGSPYGLNATVTSGIVSALNRPVSVSTAQEQSPSDGFPFGYSQAPQQDQSTTYPAIQTDAAINPGNSGGPLVNMAGQLVGINSSIRTAGSSGSIGLGFAIPIDEVMPVVQQILDKQTPTHARLGVSVGSSPDVLSPGAIVRNVESGGAADAAGLKAGDVITRIGSTPVADADSLVATIRGMRPGEKVELRFVRDGKTQTASASLGSDENSKAS